MCSFTPCLYLTLPILNIKTVHHMENKTNYNNIFRQTDRLKLGRIHSIGQTRVLDIETLLNDVE